LVGRSFLDFVPPNSRAAAQQIFLSLKTAGALSTEVRVQRPDGALCWLALEAVRLEDGRFMTFAQNVTERMEIEAEKRSLANFPNQNPSPVLRVAADGALLYANRASQSLCAAWDCDVGQQLPAAWQLLVQEALAAGLPRPAEVTVGQAVFSLLLAPSVADGYVNMYGHEVTNLKKTADALQESQAQLAGVITSAMDAIISVDADQRIVLFNHAAEEMFGYRAAEAKGQPLNLLIPQRFRSIHTVEVDNFGRGGHTTRSARELPTLTALRRGGEEFPIEASISQVDLGSQKLYTVILRDITSRVRRERELAAIAAVATALRAAATALDMQPVIVEQTASLLGADGVVMVLRDPATDEGMAFGCGDWTPMTGARIPAGTGISSDVMKTGQPYMNSNVSSDPRLFNPGNVGDANAVCCVPLTAYDQMLGVLWIGRKTTISEEELRLLSAIADIAANALHRALVVETLEQRVAERTAELVEANQQLQALDRLKNKFVSDVSHELRTPITNLKLYADLLHRSPQGKHEKYLAVIREQADRQAQLVDDILNLARLDLGADKVQFQPVMLNDIVAQVITAHRPAAEAANLSLTFRPDERLRPIPGEPNQLSQVVTNLITNAISYTPAGSVDVETHLNQEYALIEVRDTGMGVDPEDEPHLFERFYRSSRARHVRGTGLGLAIVSEIVRLHGGSIDFESRPGAGATFRVRLPLIQDRD
ncbi:MAG: PAS domain S-box protein, partial [Anaerolineales bacterium]|nr:PAS domain S-box protein [Anaerolineales bacterium]